MIPSDNGGEFSNDLFHKLSEQFNINVRITTEESQWSNCIAEHHNAVLGKMVNKLMLDEDNIAVIVLLWHSAKNALHTCYGYFPNDHLSCQIQPANHQPRKT